MNKLLSAVTAFLLSSPLLAATKEIEQAANAPSEMVDVIYVVLFGVIFFGMIIGFFVYLWYLEKKKKEAK